MSKKNRYQKKEVVVDGEAREVDPKTGKPIDEEPVEDDDLDDEEEGFELEEDDEDEEEEYEPPRKKSKKKKRKEKEPMFTESGKKKVLAVGLGLLAVVAGGAGAYVSHKYGKKSGYREGYSAGYRDGRPSRIEEVEKAEAASSPTVEVTEEGFETTEE